MPRLQASVIADGTYGRLLRDAVSGRLKICYCCGTVDFDFDLTWYGRFLAWDLGGPMPDPIDGCYDVCGSPTCGDTGGPTCPDDSGCISGPICTDEDCVSVCIDGDGPKCFEDSGQIPRCDNGCNTYCEDGTVKCIKLCSATCSESGLCPNGDFCTPGDTCYACALSADGDCPTGYGDPSDGTPYCSGEGSGSVFCYNGNNVICGRICDNPSICVVPPKIILSAHVDQDSGTPIAIWPCPGGCTWNGTRCEAAGGGMCVAPEAGKIHLSYNPFEVDGHGNPVPQPDVYCYGEVAILLGAPTGSCPCGGDLSGCPFIVYISLSRLSWRTGYPDGTWQYSIAAFQVNDDSPDDPCTEDQVWCDGRAFVSDDMSFTEVMYDGGYIINIPPTGISFGSGPIDPDEMTLLLGEDDLCTSCQAMLQDFEDSETFYGEP